MKGETVMKRNTIARKKTTIEKVVIGFIVFVALLVTVQLVGIAWLTTEVVSSVSEEGGVKESLVQLARDASDIKKAFNE